LFSRYLFILVFFNGRLLCFLFSFFFFIEGFVRSRFFFFFFFFWERTRTLVDFMVGPIDVGQGRIRYRILKLEKKEKPNVKVLFRWVKYFYFL
jgi:hypothetical protein